MAHAYFVLREAGKSDRILVWDTRTISIGRGPDNDLVVDDDEISRKHALIEKKDDRFAIGDYRTGNGTFVNGQRVQQSAEIRAGDVIRIGKLELAFVIAAEHPATRGLKVAYASHTKTVGKIPKGADGDRTMLSLTDTASGEDDEFVVEPERSSGVGAFRSGPRDEVADFQVRDLDESLDSMDLDLGSDELPISDGLEPAAAAKPPVAKPPVAKAPAARPAPARPAAPTPVGDTTRPRRAPGASAPAPAPAAAPGRTEDPTQRLRALKALLDEGLISEDEFRAKRARILDAM